MKTIRISLLAICFFFSVSASLQAQADERYRQAMQEALTLLDQAKNASELQQVLNQFTNISRNYPEAWQPIYYVAFCNIDLIYYDQGSDKNELRLAEAKKRIDQLQKSKQADASEVSTLAGYYYMAMVSLDPVANGQKYSAQVIGQFEKAMRENPANPRPVCLLAFYENFLPAFMKSSRDQQQEKERAATLFEQETPSIDHPYWGAYFLKKF